MITNIRNNPTQVADPQPRPNKALVPQVQQGGGSHQQATSHDMGPMPNFQPNMVGPIQKAMQSYLHGSNVANRYTTVMQNQDARLQKQEVNMERYQQYRQIEELIAALEKELAANGSVQQ